MATWTPKRVGDATPWIEPPPEQRNWRTACDYERNHRHSSDCGRQVNDLIVEWFCGCGATQYMYAPVHFGVQGQYYGEVDSFEYAEIPMTTGELPQARRSGCSPWLLMIVVVIVIITVIALRP